MRLMRATIVAAVAGLAVAVASAQAGTATPAPAVPTPTKAADPDDAPDPGAATSTGYIGKTKLVLEVDDCPAKTSMAQDKVLAIAREHYERGEILYVQGDYTGAVQEFTASYCLFPYFSILKDIGQAYERQLDYQRAIAYLERYVLAVPNDAKPVGVCDSDPQQDRKNVAARVSVLAALPARIKVTTQPEGAAIALVSDTGIAARGIAGDKLIETRAGRYQMTATLEGYEPVTQEIDVEVGKPYGYYISLPRQKGTLSVVGVPDRSRIFVNNRLVGVGSITNDLVAGDYTVRVDATGRVPVTRTVTVLPQKNNRIVVELPPTPETGRWQLLPAMSFAGGAGGQALETATDTGGAFTAAGLAVGFGAAYLLVPQDVPLGTSSLTVTGILGGAFAGGFAAGSLSTSENKIRYGVAVGSLGLGAAGYLFGRSTKITSGDAALINSGVIWGSAAGGLFSVSFDGSSELSSSIVFSGVAIGTITGALLTRNFELSRRHVQLIDLGGILGVALGYSTATVLAGETVNEQTRTHFALAGLAVGILGSALLTRNLDDTRVPNITPELNSMLDSSGHRVSSLGFGVRF